MQLSKELKKRIEIAIQNPLQNTRWSKFIYFTVPEEDQNIPNLIEIVKEYVTSNSIYTRIEESYSSFREFVFVS